jgi:hypothetical protein
MQQGRFAQVGCPSDLLGSTTMNEIVNSLRNPVPLIWAIFHRVTLSRRRQVWLTGRQGEFHSTHFGQLRGMAEAFVEVHCAIWWLTRVAAETTLASVFALWKHACSISSQLYHLFIFDLPIFQHVQQTIHEYVSWLASLPMKDPPLYISHIISFVKVDSLWISTIWYVSFLQFLRWALRENCGNSSYLTLYMFDNIYTYIFDITRTYFYGNRTRKEDGDKSRR